MFWQIFVHPPAIWSSTNDTLQHQSLSIMSRALDHSATFPMYMCIYICTYFTCNLRRYIFVLDCGDQKFYNNRQDASLQLKNDSSIGMLQTLLQWPWYCTVYVYFVIHFVFINRSESVHVFYCLTIYVLLLEIQLPRTVRSFSELAL
jgi:hypothetical protein